ncbi:MAG: glycosyltransferase family 2 protein [Elainella sp. Prado103]|jgi:glycosyltransferase involved in cell wall biosynthesis|nr:glycosyltransferase family 2 protein [Elainella sp. Prado103]
MPTISVIIPAYNAERTILATIASVQQQTFTDFEMIVINDGSTDHTLALLQEISDDRLKIFSYTNGGLSVARNRGIAQATGEYIALLDADDLWTVDKLACQWQALEQDQTAGVAYSWTYFMDAQGQTSVPGAEHSFTGNVLPALLVNNFIASGSNPLIRKSAVDAIGGFDPDCAGCADWDYWLRLALRYPFQVVPKHQVFYRQSIGSMSANIQFMEHCGLHVVEKTFQAVPSDLQPLKKQSLAWIYQYTCQQYLQHGQLQWDALKQASDRLWRAIILHPALIWQAYPQNLLKWLIKQWLQALYGYTFKPGFAKITPDQSN